ncbi:MAG: hypothetical protein KME06_09440 [Kastovskya adunca ATA6-11-RM4]|jgi:hypothetical protein|nr:hypothetical protein [Kastovskya adunca ATA6-11-RM4]
MDAITLRDKIQAILSDLLGTYTFPNGQTVPAISIWHPSYPPKGTEASGLEVTLIFAYESPLQPLVEANLVIYQSRLELRQWNPDDDTVEATNRLIDQLPEISLVRPRILPISQLDNIESRTIELEHPLIRRRK